jgi:hypothetical protein
MGKDAKTAGSARRRAPELRRRRRRARRSPTRGISLIEVLLATVVLATAALVAFPTLLSFFDLSSTAREENIATHDLRSAIEDLLATPFGDVVEFFPDGGAIAKYQDLHLADEQLVVTYADVDADPLEVTVTATWADHKGRPRQESYQFLRTQ